MNARLPVGVIGLGRMGQIYSRHLARLVPQSHLMCIADVIEERAKTLAAELGVESWSTDGHDARAALEIGLAATRSYKEARPVELSEYQR